MNLNAVKRFYLPGAYCLLFIGFFLFPTTKFHSRFYYLAMAAPFFVMILLKKIDMRPILHNRAFQLSALFLGYLVLSVAWSETARLSDGLTYFRRFLYILLFMGLSIHLMHREASFINVFLLFFITAAALSAVVYIVDFCIRYSLFQARLVGNGTLRNPIRASSIYGIAVFSAVYLYEVYKHRPLKWLIAASLIPSCLFILVSQSRGPMLALVLSLGGNWMLQKKTGIRMIDKKILSLIGMLAGLGIVFFLARPDIFRAFFLERGFAYRFEIWGKIISKMQSAFLFGQGLTSDTKTVMADGTLFVHPHSVYVTTFYYGGIIGLSLLLGLIGWTLRTAIASARSPLGALCSGCLMFGALCIATDGNVLIQHPKPFWVFFWFPVSLAAYLESAARHEKSFARDFPDMESPGPQNPAPA
jgi:O-antigen ligase